MGLRRQTRWGLDYGGAKTVEYGENKETMNGEVNWSSIGTKVNLVTVTKRSSTVRRGGVIFFTAVEW